VFFVDDRINNICSLFYASHYIPLAVYEERTIVHIFSSAGSSLDLFSLFEAQSFSAEQTMYILTLPEQGTYGQIRIKNSPMRVLLGPVFPTPITEDTVMTVARRNLTDKKDMDALAEFLYSIPNCSYNQFVNLTALLNFIINGEMFDIAEQFREESSDVGNKLAVTYTEDLYKSQDEQVLHGTYQFENMLLSFVRDGETDKLNAFLTSTAKTTHLREGKLAEAPLRQAKNLLIGVATMVGKVGAIGGGLGVEETYRLIDLYIQECEKTSSTEEVKVLQYNMLLDFTDRVAQVKAPRNASKEIYACMQYIQNHTNCQIGIDDVAGFIGKSRTYVTKKFRQETGESITDFIIKSKIRDAKRLLRYSNRSLSEISTHLCFSSQAYFQTVFKKSTGMTPNEYRNVHNEK